ncbi:hypothetical protein [Acinetobacter sp. A1]|uniref:hypothetical protein n=1 Tax=Acinetobacter sp. A1 TaxID=401467 RepID=UPI002090C451|nr:hypothetical protein [Acinetobacter sp. A1]
MKNKLFNIANMLKYGYINRALSKISKLALAGYNSKGAQSLKDFFCAYSLYASAYLYAGFGGWTPSGVLVSFCASLLTNPQSLHQSFSSEVQAPKLTKGAHSHA